MVSASENDDICIADLLALFVERVCADKAGMWFQAFVDSHPEVLGVTADAGERIYDASLAQVELGIVTLVQLLSGLLNCAEVHLDLLPVDNCDVVFSDQQRPRRGRCLLVQRLTGTAQGSRRWRDLRIAEAEALLPARAALQFGMGETKMAVGALLAKIHLIAFWTKGNF